MVAVEVTPGTTADSGGSSPIDGTDGAGESNLGRGAGSGGVVAKARDPGIAPNGASILAAKCRCEGWQENLLAALEKLRAESRPSHGSS